MIVLFSVFPQWVGFGNNRNGVWNFVPVLSESFLAYLPWVVVYFLSKLVFNIALARQSFWDAKMRWVGIGIKVFGLLLLFAFLTGPAVFGLNPAYLAQHNPSTASVAWFESTLQNWNTGFRIYVIIAMIVQFIQLARMIFQAVMGSNKLKFRLE